MLLKKLPPKIALLAMQRISEQGKTPSQEEDIIGQFNFSGTLEGHDYWKEIYVGNFTDPVYGERKEKIIVKLNNVLWNGSRNSCRV